MTSLRKHLLKSWGDPRFTPAWISGTSQQVGIADICFSVEKQVGEGRVLVETAHATSHGHHEEHHGILEPNVGYTWKWYTYIWCLWKRTSFSMFLHVSWTSVCATKQVGFEALNNLFKSSLQWVICCWWWKNESWNCEPDTCAKTWPSICTWPSIGRLYSRCVYVYNYT